MNWRKYGRITERLSSLETKKHSKHSNEENSTLAGDKSSTWFFHYVGDTAGTILPVLKGDFSLAGALYGDGQTASTCLSGPDTKFS